MLTAACSLPKQQFALPTWALLGIVGVMTHSHGQSHAHPTAAEPAVFWEEFYGGKSRWSGNPNQLLVDEVAELAPGTALDLGCGEGGDAIWLAEQGWTVTAVDIAQTGIDAAIGHAAEAGVGDRISWERHDLSESFPQGSFDLVSACYLQSPVELPRTAILRAAAGAVAPGGTLVIVGHAGFPVWMTSRPDLVMPTPDDVLADLELPEGEWEVERSELIDRPATDPEGNPGTRPDGTLRLRRLT